jgi:hypothetical protein
VSRLALGSTKPPVRWVLGALSLGLEWLGCEADHSPASSTKVKNMLSYTSTPPYIFMAWYFIKHVDIFTFYLIRPTQEVALPFIRTWKQNHSLECCTSLLSSQWTMSKEDKMYKYIVLIIKVVGSKNV